MRNTRRGKHTTGSAGIFTLPSDEDVIGINANRDDGEMPGAGSLPLSIFVGTLPVDQTNDARRGFLASHRLKRALSG